MTFRIEGQVEGNGGNVGGLDVEIWEDGGSWDTPRAIVQTSSNGWFVAQVDPALFSGGGAGGPPALAYFKVIQDGVELVNTFHDVEWDSSSPSAVRIDVVPRPETEECCPDYIIRGVVETAPGAGTPVGFPGWTVELWEDGAGWDLPRAVVVTESDGTFRVELGGNAFATAARTIRFRVANHGDYVSPDPTPTWNPTLLDTIVHLAISVSAVRTHVEGFLRYRDGSPVASYSVKGFASQMRTEDLVGSGTTNADGHFVFDCAYTGAKFDLILRADDGSATPVEVAHSALIPDAPELVTVDLVVGNTELAGKAEYTRMMDAIDAARGAVSYASLTDADLTQIAAKYLLPKDRLQLAVDANLASSPGLSPELFYAIGYRAGRVTVSSALSLSAADRAAAVDEAIARNLVSSAFAATATSQLATLAGTVTSLTLTDPTSSLPTRLSMILQIGGLTNATHRTTLINAYTAYAGTPEEFWSDAPTLTGLSSAALNDARSALHIGVYTLNHPPMVQSLWNSSIRTAEALGSLSTSDWATRIASTVTLPGSSAATVGFPNEVVGANDTEKSANYAAALTTVNMRAFPSNAFRTAYTATPISGTTGVATFLSANPTFDFAKQSLFEYVRAHPTAFSGNEAAKPLVERMARLFKIVPEVSRYASAKKLWDAGFESARSVYLAGKEPFIAKMTSAPYSLTSEEADQIFAKSSHLAAVASTIALTYGAPFQPPGEGGALSVLSESTEIADWDAIFGGLDYCACDECASVHGPAAYLTDILHFLEQRKSTTPSVTALDVLKARRPDLTKIELTCINTNTVTPYIDLLNEQLEIRVNSTGVDYSAYQTTWTETELSVHPEHLRAEAYDDLKAKVYPFTQPYSLWVDESRSYVALKSVSRAEIRAATLADPPSDAAWQTEVLGMTELQKQIIQGSGSLLTGVLPNQYWGMPTGSPWFDDGSTTLTVIPTLMKKSGLGYEDLAAEIATTYVSRAQGPAVGIDLHGGCDVASATLTNVTASSDPFFSRLHRFDRLRRSLGWTIHQTDRAIQSLGYGNLDATLPPELAAATELSRRTKAKVDDVLTWRSGTSIDTTPDPKTGTSPFEKMFPRRNVATGDETFTLARDRTKLAVEETGGTLPLLVDHLTAIAKGFGTDIASLRAILETIFEPSSIASKPLTLQHLSRLYRYVSLAKAMKLSVVDLLALLELDGMTPFDVALYRLPLTAWWKASYAGAPWAGTASAGTSGTHAALTAGSSLDPTVGTAVNGMTPASFGTKYLRDDVNGVGAYISASGYRVVALIKVATNAAPAGNAYDDAAIIATGTTAEWGLAVNANEVVLFHKAGSYATLAQPLTEGWHVIDAAYDGTSISLSVDGNTPMKATAGNLSGLVGAAPLMIGARYDASVKFVGDVAEIIVSNDALTNVAPEAFRAYFEARYALDLSWTPKKNVAGATLLLRADIGVTLVDGKVSAWADQSGVGDSNRNAVQAMAARRPAYQAINPHFGGNPTIDCIMDGTQERFLKTGTWGAPTINSEATVAVVCRRAGSPATNRYLFDALSGTQFAFYENSTGDTHYALKTANYVSRSGDLVDTSALILWAKNGQTAQLRVNSNSTNSATATDPGAFTPAGFTIGCYEGAGPYSDFEIAEFCVWLRQLSTNEIKALNSYFATRYGVPIAP